MPVRPGLCDKIANSTISYRKKKDMKGSCTSWRKIVSSPVVRNRKTRIRKKMENRHMNKRRRCSPE
jgi:hypothetical protein